MSIFIKNIKYKIIKELGKGTFGRVVEVEKDNKYYAIKEIKIEGELKDKINEIQKEAEILSKFDNKNIVKYYDSYLDKDKFYILMEYCDGKNLRDFIYEHIKKKELIEEDILYNIIKQLCIGIKEIHEKNVIHRDLKPENIFMNSENEIKIGDFGISKQFNPNLLNEMNINELERSIFIKNIEYKIIKELRVGEYGRTIQVEKDNKYYVIKEIEMKDEIKDIIKDIKKDTEILSKFNLKNIVKYYDSFQILYIN